MDIAVIGSGRIGGRLARGWTQRGHTVVVGVRDPRGPKAQEFTRDSGVPVASIEEAARRADVIVFAVPNAALDGLIPVLAPIVSGKVVIDTTNAIVRPAPADPGGPVIPQLKSPPVTSAAEELAVRLPGARVIKAFNAQGAEIIDRPAFDGIAASNFFCGDDPEARRIAAQLIADVGFDPVDLGPLRSARQLEMLTLLWFEATATAGTRDIAFRLLRRS
jgi:predicted dinucleotide-binding enzyme